MATNGHAVDVVGSLEIGVKLQAQALDGTWYVAELLAISTVARRAKRPFKVRYLGYTTNWDEWLPSERLRSRALRPSAGPAAGLFGKEAQQGCSAPPRSILAVLAKQEERIAELERSLALLLEDKKAEALEDKKADEEKKKSESEVGEKDEVVKQSEDKNRPPPRPTHYVLRPGTDPRLDQGIFVRYDAPEDCRTGAIMIVIPGGNYDICGVDCNEGQPIAQWLASRGVTSVVLQYRCVYAGHHWPAQMEDYEACMREVMARADSWRCDPLRVGVMGFSAGGHLAGYAALRSCPELRPKLQVLVYPAVNTLSPIEGDAIEPWRADMGYPPVEASLQLLADAAAPPAFVAGVAADDFCPPEENTTLYAEALLQCGVACEYVFCEDESMGHGCGLRDWWALPCAAWLQKHGWASSLRGA